MTDLISVLAGIKFVYLTGITSLSKTWQRKRVSEFSSVHGAEEILLVVLIQLFECSQSCQCYKWATKGCFDYSYEIIDKAAPGEEAYNCEERNNFIQLLVINHYSCSMLDGKQTVGTLLLISSRTYKNFSALYNRNTR